MKKITTSIQQIFISLGIIEHPKKAQERKNKELIAWAATPMPEQEAAYVIIQPLGLDDMEKEKYPYKIFYTPGVTKIDSADYEIKAYARTKEEAEKKEAVFMKLWMSK